MNFAIKLLSYIVVAGAGLVAVTLAVAMVLVFWPPPKIAPSKDVYGFANLRRPTRADNEAIRAPLYYRARDGAQLAYRFYDSKADRILIFVHGSSYHGVSYDALARALSERGLAKVYLPNIRGHYLSGLRSGDVDYVGQIEDDIADLVAMARANGQHGPVILGGHSSGGGFAIRFAGGPDASLVSGYLLLSPVLPLSPIFKRHAGWATVDLKRTVGLSILDGFGITAFDGMPTIWFNKPEALRDGTETLVYSYRLNTSMHPRLKYERDVASLGNALIVVGAEDQQNYAKAYAPMMQRLDPAAKVVVLPHVDHLGVMSDPAMIEAASQWLEALH